MSTYDAPFPSGVSMLHTGRCGSTVLGRMLNQHPSVYWAGEVFENMRARYPHLQRGSAVVPLILLEAMRAGAAAGKPQFGFETKYLQQQHLRRDTINLSLVQYLATLKAIRPWRFIVLRRDNYLRRAISVQVGRVSDQWHSSSAATSPTRVTLNVAAFETGDRRDSLLDLFSTLDASHDEVIRLLQHDDVLDLSYEDHVLLDPRVGYRMICDFIGIESVSVTVPLARTNPFPLELMVENIDEVRRVLTGTRYEWMLTR